MAKLSLLAGTTSKTVKVFIQNNSVTTGAGLTGLAFGTSGLTAYYIREGASASVQITLATATLGTWATGGFIVVDGTNMPGLYELGIPNLALAAGAKSCTVYLQGAANMAPAILEIELTAVDNQSTGFGLVNASANVAQINSVSTASVTTINANQGTTQPLNFTGTAGSALVKSDTVDIAGTAVSATTAQLGVNVVNWNNTVVATPATAGIPDVNTKNINNIAAATPGASGGVLISGSNSGTTTLGALTVTGATTHTGNVTMAAGLTITQSTTNGNGLSITGNGTGHGVLATSGSGATGDGLKAVAASTNGNGVTAVLAGSGRGISALFPEGYTTQSTASSYELGNLLWDVHQRLYARSVASTTETVLKQDGSTTAHTITLNSSTAPTSAIQAT